MFDEAEGTRPWLTDAPSVTAILIAHDGMAWLPSVLTSFAKMDYAPSAWQAVDVSSTDGSGDLLRQSFGAERVTYAPSGTGFGAAVQRGLDAAPGSEWIWLLHDDSAVEPGTLAALLDEATRHDDVAIVGPKIREWPSLLRILEVGITVAGTGARVTGLEPGEPDAGQHDRPADVLAVNTAGMLIRRSVWEELGGFEPTLSLYGDDLDLGWRAARAGWRVRTAPAGIVFHAEAASRGNRPISAGDVPSYEFRRAALFVLLANVRTRAFVWTYLRLLVGSLVRVVGLSVLGFLVAKAPEAAGDELNALRSVYLHPGELRRARHVRAATTHVGAGSIRQLLPSRWLPYQHGYDAFRDVVNSVLRPRTVETGGRRTSVRRASAFDEIADEIADENASDSIRMRAQPSFIVRHPWLSTMIVLIVVSLAAGRGLLTGGYLQGGALLPAPDTAGLWWQLFFERWHQAGIGSDIAAPAYVLILAVASTPLWFSPDLLLTILLLGAAPLAALTAHRLSRRFCANQSVRIIGAIAYGLAVVGTGAVAQGRIGTVVAMIVTPILVSSVLALVQKPGWQQGLRAGLWLSLAVAFAPVVLPMTIVIFVFVVLVAGRQVAGRQVAGRQVAGRQVAGRQVLVPLAIAVVVPAVLIEPWLWQRLWHPQGWWLGAGRADAGAGPFDAGSFDALFGRAGGSGAAPGWLYAGLVVLAALTLFAGRRRRTVFWAWGIASVGLFFTVIGSSLTITARTGVAGVSVWTGAGAIVWLGGLILAVAAVADDLVAEPLRVRFVRAMGAMAISVALLAPVGTGLWWLIRGEDDPLHRGPLAEVPAYLAAHDYQRTLVLDGDLDDGVGYDVVYEAGLRLGQEAVLPGREEIAGVTATVKSLLSNPSTADMEALAGYGISAIYAPADVDPELARRLDATAGLSPSGSDDPRSRVWLLESDAVPPVHDGGYLRWLIAGLQVVAAIVAIVLTLPVRQRRRQR